MTQKLYIEIQDAEGRKSLQEVHVIRSWQEASGVHVFLFANGSYGYRNGAPIKRPEDFAIITSTVQRKAAEAWWQRAGKALSESYYAAQADREKRLSGDFNPAGTASESELDSVLYQRQPASDPTSPAEGPFSWMDLFQARPDWWGQAQVITFKDWTYAQLADAPAESVAAGKPLPPGGETTTAVDKNIKPAGKK